MGVPWSGDLRHASPPHPLEPPELVVWLEREEGQQHAQPYLAYMMQLSGSSRCVGGGADVVRPTCLGG